MSKRVNSNRISKVVIVGGGTAGWMAAAALVKYFDNGKREITLVESDAIGTVGVGEATIPPIKAFNSLIGIREDEFLRETKATFKLGIDFVNWGRLGTRYIHPFGPNGSDFHGIDFHQFYLRQARIADIGPIEEYSMSACAALRGKFGRAKPGKHNPLHDMLYAFHFDAGLYAAFLRKRAEQAGVVRHEGKITRVHRDGETGNVASVELESGATIEGDLFIDCTGFRGLLIEETLQTGFQDWSHWLPMDSALAMPTTHDGQPDAFTRATAHAAGWQWRIPLQHRMGNGHVFCSKYMDTGEAETILRDHCEGEVLADPRLLRFTTGMRTKAWNHNVVALGLSSGFLEPLESTSIHLIQNGIQRLFALFPDNPIEDTEREEYNRGMRAIYEDVRDFIILHYKATQRNDTPFWQFVQEMEVPDTLKQRLELWRLQARVMCDNSELFSQDSWVAVLLGQGIWPDRYSPIIDTFDEAKVGTAIGQMRQNYAALAERLPTQREFLERSGVWVGG